MDRQECLKIQMRGTLIYDDHTVMLQELDKSRSRIDRQGRSADYKKISLLDSLDRRIDLVMLQILLIKRNGRSYDTAALRAARDSVTLENIVEFILLAAIHAIVPVYGTVKFYRILGTRHLMQTVDILGYYRLKLTLTLKPGEGLMSLVRLSFRIAELFLVKIEELFGMFDEERMRYDINGPVIKARLLIEDTGTAPEIRYAALRGNACAAQKNDIIRLRDQLL